MSQYTITINQLLKSKHKIFDFDYPTLNEQHKLKFESEFLDYFILDEIGHETIQQFKIALKSKLNLIMPKYNKILETQLMEQRILDNYDVTETYERNSKGSAISNARNDYKSSSKTVDKNLYKDTPKTKIDIESFDYVTNITKNLNDNEGTNTNTNTTNDENINNETWTRKMTGNIGIQTDSDAIIKYWDSIRNVNLEIFENELSSLFMGVL